MLCVYMYIKLLTLYFEFLLEYSVPEQTESKLPVIDYIYVLNSWPTFSFLQTSCKMVPDA